jgi:signal transduction histidine kinase
MPSAPLQPPVNVLIEDTARREHAKQRFYVWGQVGGWGLFFSLQVLSLRMFVRPQEEPRPLHLIVASLFMVSAVGLLVSHYSRPLLERWGWKQLGWRALIWRVCLMAVAQSLAWTVIGFIYTLGLNWICDVPWSSKFTVGQAVMISWINGAFIFLAWHCIYFFYHLFDRFNRLEIERLRLTASVKEAELRALKSQINPHFIFNSLNSLRALIDEDPTRARQAVTQLANLLRYSLQSAQSETVAFEDELRVVNDYLALEQVRHEERLRLRLDIEPDTLGLAVPPLLLQTLVENAVKYGISNRPEGGEIVISARCEGGNLRLRVTNPGELADGAKLAKSASSTGLGLKNAAERLKMFFGDRAQLQLRAETDSLVVAEVTLPVQMTRG